MFVIDTTSEHDMLRKYIDIFSVLYVPETKWLSVREKDYLIANILLNMKGYDLSSKKVVSILENTFGFKNKGVYIYRMKLKEKGWIIQTKDGLELPKAFSFKSIPKNFDFKIRVSLKQPKVELKVEPKVEAEVNG